MYDYTQELEEEWRGIPGFYGYSVSSRGRVKNDDTGRILKHTLTTNGGVMVGLMKGGTQSKRYVAQLVANAFVLRKTGDEPDLDYDTPMHINGDKTDCRKSNLIWATRSQAILHHQHFSR